MRHNRVTNYFNRKSGPRKALLRGLVVSLVEHERIRTTLAKAKELRRHVEKAITKGKGGTLHDFRQLMSDYPNEGTVTKIVKDLSPRFKTRPGGYTRIIKLGTRPGDKAEMAFIEFVDYNFEAAAEKKAKATYKVKVRGADRKMVTKELNAEEYAQYKTEQTAKAAASKRKVRRTIQKTGRRTLRANAK